MDITFSFYSVDQPPELPKNYWRTDKPLLLEKLDGEIVIGFYAKVEIENNGSILKFGENIDQCKWLCKEPFHPDEGKEIEVRRWAYLD